eukprot:754794-Hanusia_phi.AAC.5
MASADDSSVLRASEQEDTDADSTNGTPRKRASSWENPGVGRRGGGEEKIGQDRTSESQGGGGGGGGGVGGGGMGLEGVQVLCEAERAIEDLTLLGDSLGMEVTMSYPSPSRGDVFQ